jgi:ribose transport system permease protein
MDTARPAGLVPWLTAFGMLGVLVLLCAAFSVATIAEQRPTGVAAARLVAAEIRQAFGDSARVMLIASTTQDDQAFADQLHGELGGQIVVDVRGDPRAARTVLEKAVAAGQQLDAIACTPSAASWLLIEQLPQEFPALANVQVIVARPYLWPNFLKRENLLNIANQIAVIAIVAIGMTFVIITGGIDLSVGSLIGLSAIVSTLLIRSAFGGLEASALGMLLCCLAGVLVCGGIGGLTGMFITTFRVPPFIVTLAMMLIARGTAHKLTGGESVFQIPASFVWLGRGADLFGIPNAVVLMIVLYLLAHGLMTRTVLGRYLYAVGGNAQAARFAGVPVQRVLVFAYVMCGLLAGLGGVIMASQLKSGSPNYADGYELSVIAAVVVGGASLSGGEGRMFGTLVGAFIIAVMRNGLNLMGVDDPTQNIVLGTVILAAVLLDQQKHRLHAARRL